MSRCLRAIIAIAGLSIACGGETPIGPSAPPTPPAPTLYTITGLVTSLATNAGLQNATVRVAGGPNDGLAAITDQNGRYTLNGLSFAGFVVGVTAQGFLGATRAVPLTAGVTSTTANFALLPEIPWSQGGIGNTVFTMPSYFDRVRITALPISSCENFSVRIGGAAVVNTILGTCSAASARSYDSIHPTNGGGMVEIVNSPGAAWGFLEQR